MLGAATDATDHMETDADRTGLLRPPTVQRLLRDAVLFDGRVARLPRPVGRRHRYHVPVRRSRTGQPSVLHAAPRAQTDAGRRV